MTDWHLVNLVLPTVVPLLILAFVSLFHMTQAQQRRVSPWVAVKDGQLAWAALGMCFNALYELDHPSKQVAANWVIFARWAFIGLVVLTALTASFGPVLMTPTARPKGVWVALWHYRVFWGSVLQTVAAAYLYAQAHLTTQA